jgi:hypothetical protein
MADKVSRSEIEGVAGEKDVVDYTSMSQKSESQELDKELERRVVRKTDLNLVPILFLLFLCAFVDR